MPAPEVSVAIATDPVKKHPSPQTMRLRISCNRTSLAAQRLIKPANFKLGGTFGDGIADYQSK
jgi:hypothetical protein